MKGIFPIDKFRTLQTPFYYYDTKVLRDTLSAINHEVAKYPNYSVHYAVKANANPKVLAIIRESGMGADCVSGGEIRAAIRDGRLDGYRPLLGRAALVARADVDRLKAPVAA